MNRDLIIQHLTKVTYIKEICKIAGDLSDDLFQHIWVKLLEFEHTKLEAIYAKGYIQFYIYRMIVNESRNKNNPFRKNNRSTGNYHNDLKVLEEKVLLIEEYDHEIDTQIESIKGKLNEMFWYDKKIFELYVEFGSLRKVALQTGIKYGAIHQTVTKVKKKINENIISRSF